MASSKFPVAVIGIGVRLPGAQNCEEFWKLMIDGKDTVDEFPKERAGDIDHVLSSFRDQLVDEDKPFFTGSFFKSVDQFDPDLFQINPREALFIEPEQRLFLEVVWELLEDAGYASKIRGTNTGVYVGNTVNKYKYILNENHPSISHGNHSPFISSRVSYTHDLHGPAMMVATGCSSSLLAVHLACQGLLSGDCDMAVAGGITLDLLPISAKTDIWNQLGITGPHVKCRAFDASAKGIAKGEGCGVVLLKPLQKAIEDGDHIYGILEATTANQDGHSNGITAPHPIAQANMLHQAWKLADITPDSLGFFEAHGTGTELGDPIEISGITNAFKMSGVKIPQQGDRKIPIGSVKANIGHLADGAAGVVGLIKSLLCLHHNSIPGAINFTNPNPHINWKQSPVFVNSETKEWLPSSKAPRYASVSAFGLLGTNIHAVVKEYQPPIQSPSIVTHVQETHCLCLAANTAKSLEAYSCKLLSYLRQCHNTSNQMLRNICYSINTGREQSRFKYRAVISANNMEDLMESLDKLKNILHNETIDIPCTENIAFNLNGNTHCPTKNIHGNHSTAQKLMIQNFISGKRINWNDIYQDKCDLQRVPQLPTYQFERMRLWPKIDNPINSELLQLEHKFVGRTDYHSFLADHKDNTTGNFKSSTETIRDMLVRSLSDALNMAFDWEQGGDENLFELGMDSLIFSLIAMKIKSEIGIDLSMGEFHKNPTFNGLLSTIITFQEERKQPNKGKGQSNSNAWKIEVCGVKPILGNALNEALGQDIDWNAHSEDNLFSLGVDSLIYTHVNMKLKEATNLDTPITMAELHENPTFSSLYLILNAKLCQVDETVSNIQETEKKHEGELYPISFAQRRLWVMEEMVDNACTYNATNCLKIMGDFHPNAFRQALHHVLENNVTFVTVFEDGPEGPLQKYDHTLNLDLKTVNLSELNEKAEEVAMEQYSIDYKTPFDLYKGPLVRCTLYILSSNTFYFTMVVHHIIFDGWSHFVFYNELWSSYRYLIEGNGTKLLKPKMTYADIAVEEQMNSQSPTSRITKDMEYWKKKLIGDIPLITFPGDKKRPPVFTYNGKRITKFIPHEVFEKLKQCSTKHHTTFMNILSSVFCLLKRYTGEKDLIIGTPIAGRHDANSKDVIGCFINTLALRVNLEDNLNFKQVLEEVLTVCLEAYGHQQAPFDHLVSQLNLPRDTSITPVFSINVCYHNTETKADHVNPPEELTVERKLLHNDSSKWDMQFDFLEEPEGMRFTLEFYSDLFSDEYANLIVDSYISLLNSISNCPSQPIELLHLNPPVDEIRSESSVLVGPKRDLGSKPLPTLLHESITTNHASEIIDGQTRIKYVDLGKNVQKLASFLRLNCKLTKGSRVGLLMDNTTKSIESVLSCLMSGLVYVPMDVNSPKSRLQHISLEADLKAILFSKQYLNLANSILWSCSNVESLVCIDTEDFDALIETEQTPLMDIELWDCVAIQAEDGIEGGGWKSSYTGEHMTKEEMAEYSNNIYQKLLPFLNKSTRVLEIGSASGLTTKMIKPHVGSYVATDLSNEMVKKLKECNKDEPNMEFMCGAADEVCKHFQGRQFDVIIMNSVVHCFPGYNYLKDVIRNCEKMLSSDGVIFIGDVMDLDMKEELVSSMKTFKADNPTLRTKTDWNNELFIPRRFLQQICSSSQIVDTFKDSRKIYSIPNELTEFRYDALLSRSQNNKNEVPSKVSTYALKDVEEADLEDLSLFMPHIGFTDEAYILFTSGTSGTPKGVIISHGALLNYVQWASRIYEFSPQTSTPFFAPLTFDFTITSILPPLLKGSQIFVYKNFQDHYQEIAKNRQLTTGKFSPLQLDMLLDEAKSSLSIKTFIIGGEELKSSLMSKLKKNKGNQDFAIWNEYGPTEATVGCVVKCFKNDDLPLKDSELVTIGHPIDNTVVGVVRNNQLAPIGGKGSLAIGGRCLCNGFAGKDKDKTTKAFKNSVWSQPAERMLITDDVCEILPGIKEMAYFGRNENGIVKVNGIRVDLQEIQKALEDILFVQSAWVCCFDYEENTLLGAALVLRSFFPEKSTWQKSVLATLQNSLPLRIIPKVLIEISKPPINKNGKTDMKFLKDQCRIKMQESSSQEGSNIESSLDSSPRLVQVQRIWQRILPINFLPRPNQNFFFELSGDSLQAIHLVRKMRDEGFKVTVTDIFQHPTIEQLLPVLEVIGDQNIQKDEEGLPFKPTPILEEYILNERKYPDHFALSALLDFHYKINADLLRKALRCVMQKHGSLRSKIVNENGRVFQEVLPLKPDQPKIVDVEFESKEKHLSDEQEFIEICEELDRGHSLADGILVGAAVFHIKCPSSEVKCYGLLVVHHAAIDIVSWQQILEDLAVALKALSKNKDREPVLKPCQLPLRVYCDAVHKASGEIFSSEVDYWTDIQEKSKESGILVQDDVQSHFKTAKWFSKSIDATSLRSTSTCLGCSDEQVLLTAFGRAMSAIHGKHKTSLCMESHGRQLDAVDSTDTVGWCTSMYPFILDTPLGDDMVEQVKKIGQDLNNIPNKGLGFGLLKSAGKITMAHPKVTFIFQGSLDASSKETFDGGDYPFDHIPWIEIMLRELQQRRFHRHKEELLEFDLEFIAWIHSGELKFGCLFDEKTISQSIVEEIVQRAEMNLSALSTKVHKQTSSTSINIIPGFNLTPECKDVIQDALSHHQIHTEYINIQPAESFIQSLYQSPSSAKTTFIIPRLQTEDQKKEVEMAMESYRVRNAGKTVVLNIKNLPSTLPISDSSANVDVIIDQSQYEPTSDTDHLMPLSKIEYTNLALKLARLVRKDIKKSSFKVIAVDGDYTLWHGECAEGKIELKDGHIQFQKFLLEQKNNGMLLVLLSKNEQQDVEDVFENSPKNMVLKREDFVQVCGNWNNKYKNLKQIAKYLNLGLNSILFIDDNVLECEEMLRNIPEVLTLLCPSDQQLMAAFINSLWLLDHSQLSYESANRTQMYQEEFTRIQEINNDSNNIDSLKNLLRGWDMDMVILETTIKDLKDNAMVYNRANELLHRTNQFKLNDTYTDMDTMSLDTSIYIVSLKDKHGSYGIVSVCITNNKSEVLQWVISCRALNRFLENRILKEVFDKQGCSNQAFYINKTKRNTPLINFMKTLGVVVKDGDELGKYEIRAQIPVEFGLHQVNHTTNIADAGIQQSPIITQRHSQTVCAESSQQSILKLQDFIQNNWTPLLVDQSNHHLMFPLVPTSKYVFEPIDIQATQSLERVVKALWVEVLGTEIPPTSKSNFLIEGGTSFAAVFLVTKLRRLLRKKITIVDLLKNPLYGDFLSKVTSAEDDAERMENPESTTTSSISAAQRRMIIMQETAPESTAYTETLVSYVQHPVDTEHILKKLLESHPILKTITNINAKGEYSTTYSKAEPISTKESIGTGEDVKEFIKETTPVIPVLSSPLYRFRNISTGHRHHIVLHVHHIICDDVTLMSMKRTLHNLLNGAEFRTTEFENPYQLFLQTEAEYMKSNKFETDEAYWRDIYSTLPQTSEMISNISSCWNDTTTYRANQQMAVIPKEAHTMVQTICHTIQITEFQYYLSVTAMVLQQYLGTSDICFPVPISNRSFRFQHSDGLFVNTVVPRIKTNHLMTLKENIKNISEECLKMMEHSAYPLDCLTSSVWKIHGQSLSTLCIALFNFVIKPSDAHIRIPSKHAKMPISIDVLQDKVSGETELILEWAEDLVPSDMAKRMFESLFEVLSSPDFTLDKRLQETSFISKTESKIKNTFSKHQEVLQVMDVPCQSTMDAHTKENGKKVAVVCDEVKLTYNQLDSMANAVAQHILSTVESSILKKQPVVLVMEKNEKAIATILGIWKAGGYFLPVSLSNISTIKDICENSNPALVLTSTTEDVIPGIRDRFTVINVNDIANDSSKCISVTSSIDDLAYVIRTSGSTGTPKQCKIRHRSLQVMAASWKKAYRMTEFEVTILQWAPLSFDVFVGDLVRALISVAGTLVVCPDERRLDVSYILSTIKRHQVSIMEVTPQFGQQLVENAVKGDLDTLNTFILGSDTVQTHLYNRIKSHLRADQRLLNSYGMTEATIDSSFFEGSPPNTASGTVPIGKPLPGVIYHIVNKDTLQPCPIGTAGELYIGGDVLAEGDVDLVRLPLTDSDSLKTGDVARWLPCGSVELLGRLDNMVKLRGFRISTTEIENKIASIDSKIKSVCVLPLSNNAEVEFLCAFITVYGVDDGFINKVSVSQNLRRTLPYYMIPDIAHIIEKIPLTSNGKVDRKALPKIDDLLNEGKSIRSVAHTEKSSTVSILTAIFAEAIGLDAGAIDKDLTFMEQGGHSLILLRFASSIKMSTKYDVGISHIFSYPSISALANFINEQSELETNDEPKEQVNMNTSEDDIAITGIGMRLPGGIESLPEFWKILIEGDDMIQEFPKHRKQDFLRCINATKADMYSKFDTFQGSFLDNIDQFDHQFFKIVPGEAKFMSPEQRLFLQVSTEALIEARDINFVKGSKIGVFVSNSEIGYGELDQPSDAVGISGLMPGMIATRVAYQWDLKGPTMLVDTACSSSLMALKLASECIKKGECEGALVGGSNLIMYPARKGVHGDTGILSQDFHCNAFDKDATGTAVGEGVICFYIEPLQNALQKNKHIYAVLKGVASNSVGHGNGITAPTATSQQAVIEAALNITGLKPSDLSYIETHGTGTKLGDRIELSALSNVFSARNCVNELHLGATKTTFGHLDSAAGMIGVLKVLAINIFKNIPPMHLFRNPHPELEDSSLIIPRKQIPITTGKFYAGVSSFGLTGTNCHAIISQSPVDVLSADDGEPRPLILIAKNMKQLKSRMKHIVIFIEQTIIKSPINSLTGLCVQVAKQTEQLIRGKLVQADLKLVIYVKNPHQALKTLNMLSNVQSEDEIDRLASMRSDIDFGKSSSNEVIQHFLSSDEIAPHRLYSKEDLHHQAFGVCIDMFCPTRHWCDPSASITSHNEGLLEILQRKITDAREMVRSLPLAATTELKELEGRFCVAVIIKLLLATKLEKALKENTEVTLRKSFKDTGMLPKYDKLYYVMIRELFENNVVIPTGKDRDIHCLDSFQFQSNHLLDIDPEPIAKFAMDKYHAWSDCFRFPLYCSKYLTKVLWGKMSPLSVIYPQGDLNYMYQFDKLGDLIGDVYYNMYMQMIASYAKQLSSQGRKVRVLEVGAGMGHVTRQLIPKLKDTPNVEYWFTDLGKAFVENAKTLFEDYQYMMKFSTFDITKNAPKQGLLGSYDIVISYNVIHTTESVMDSVTNLKSCVGDDGTLFVIESAKNETWATLAWGILDGWWYFKDYDLRPDEPMMEPEKWERVLKGAGFGSVHSCPVDAFEREQVEKFLFVCSAKPLIGELKKEPGWWETINLNTRRHQDLEEDVVRSTDTGVDEAVVGRTAVHRELKQIWCELLGLDDIQPNDDFNSLGGESLLAIQMMTLVRKRIGYQLEIADTFGYPTLGALATYIADQLDEDEETVESNEQWVNISNSPSLSDIDESECCGTLLMFPGQGAQKPGMCTSMRNSSSAKSLFARAETIIGYDILDMCLNNNEEFTEKLKSTEFVQVVLLVGCLAKIEQLKEENPDVLHNVTHVSGLSVGEFAALVYADVISFEDAVRVIQIRGRAMENEVKQSATGMVSVFGPTCQTLSQFLAKHYPCMKISTYLADNQHTVAGTADEVESLVNDLSSVYKEELGVIDARRLRVAGGFHSSYMKNASKIVDPVIASIQFSKPTTTLIMNVTGGIERDPEVIKELLCEQLVAPVQWKQSVLTAYEAGVMNFIEVAPARVLSSIVKNRISTVKNCNCELIVV